MAANNTKSSLDTLFKRTLADKINVLMPSSAVMMKLYPSISKELGREYLEPVALTHEHGVTYGDGDLFTLEASVAGTYTEAKVDSNPVVLKSRLSQSAVNRMLADERTFMKLAGFRSKVMKESLIKRAEIGMLYGQSGIGTVESAADVSSGTGSVVVSAATWSPAIWGGMENANLDVWSSDLATQRNSNAAVVISSVDPDTRTLSLTGNETDLDAIQATDILFFRGSKSNEMAGLSKIITNTGSLFNISASTYQLWKGTSESVTGALTFGKILKGAAKAVARGGLDSDAICLVPPRAFEQLNEDYSAYRSSDSSYKAGKGENGVESIDFHYQAGRIRIVPAPYLKEGEAMIFAKDDVIRVGARDVTFGTDFDADGKPLEYFHMLESVAGYEMRCQYDFSIFGRAPAKMVKISGITYS